MNFQVDEKRLKQMSKSAVLASPWGWLGIGAASVSVVVGVGLMLFLQQNATGGFARGIHARDAVTMHALGMAAMGMALTLAFCCLFGAWKKCNKLIGLRQDQMLSINNSYLHYEFHPQGFADRRARVVVIIDLRNAGVYLDTSLGVINIAGNVRTHFYRNIEREPMISAANMTLINSYQIPNCFTPDLFQTLYAITTAPKP